MSEIEQRAMTASEQRWWKELKQCLKRLPKNIELHARMGEIGVAPIGSRDASVERHGNSVPNRGKPPRGNGGAVPGLGD